MPDESRPDFFLCDIPQEATLNAEMVLAAADTLRKNAETYLHPRKIEHQVALIENLVKLWSDEMYPLRRELLSHCGKAIRFSQEIFTSGLEETLKSLTRDRIYQLLKIELGNERSLDTWYRHLQNDDEPSHASHHFSLRLVGAHYQQFVPAQMIVFICKCLLARTSQWIICGSEVLEVARLLAHSIYQVDSKAAACIEIVDEKRIQPHIELIRQQCEYYRKWDFNIEQPLASPHNLGFVWISQDYLTQNGTARLIRHLANDVTAWDQLYPCAPSVIFVQQTSGNAAERLAEDLYKELEILRASYPQYHYDEARLKRAKIFQTAYQLRAQQDAGTLLFVSETNDHSEHHNQLGCSVIYEMETRFSFSMGNRFVFVHPAESLSDLLHIIENNRNQIGCVGLAATGEEAPALAKALALWGVPRICGAGMMHRPCIFKEGGMTSLSELTYKSFWEKSYNA